MPANLGTAELVFPDGTSMHVLVTQISQEYERTGGTTEFTCVHYHDVFPQAVIHVPAESVSWNGKPLVAPVPKGKPKRKLAL